MHRNGQHESAPHIGDRAFRNARPRTSFYKKTLIIVSYATACAIVALGMAYWPASAGNILTRPNVLPAHLTSASDVSNQIHKAERFSGASFDERWSATLSNCPRSIAAAVALTAQNMSVATSGLSVGNMNLNWLG